MRKYRNHKAELPLRVRIPPVDMTDRPAGPRLFEVECGRAVPLKRAKKRWGPNIDCIPCNWRRRDR